MHGFFDARYLPNVGYGAKAYVIETPRGNELATNASPINNNSIVPHHPVMSAEYDALLALLHRIKSEFPNRSTLVMGDNRGVVHQLVNGAKQKGLREKRKKALHLLDELKVDVKWVPRSLNKKADSLTNNVDIDEMEPARVPMKDVEREEIPDMPEGWGIKESSGEWGDMYWVKTCVGTFRVNMSSRICTCSSTSDSCLHIEALQRYLVGT